MRRLTPLAALLVVPALLAADDRWTAPEAARAQVSPVEFNDRAIAAGKVHYDERCIMCHGTSGLGDGKSAGYLIVPPGDLSSKACQDQSDGELFWKITEGLRPMPGFSSKMSEEERWQVIAFVRTLAIEPPAPAAPE